MAALQELDTNLPHETLTVSRSAGNRSPFSEANNPSTISKTKLGQDVTNPNIAKAARQAALCGPIGARQISKKRKELRKKLIAILPIEKNWEKVVDVLTMIESTEENEEIFKDGFETLWRSFQKSPEACHLKNVKEMIRKCKAVEDAMLFLKLASETTLPIKKVEYFFKAGEYLDKAAGNRNIILLKIRHLKELYFYIERKINTGFGPSDNAVTIPNNEVELAKDRETARNMVAMRNNEVNLSNNELVIDTGSKDREAARNMIAMSKVLEPGQTLKSPHPSFPTPLYDRSVDAKLNELTKTQKKQAKLLNKTKAAVNHQANILIETREVLKETRDVVESNGIAYEDVINYNADVLKETRDVLKETRDVVEYNGISLGKTQDYVKHNFKALKEKRQEDRIQELEQSLRRRDRRIQELEQKEKLLEKRNQELEQLLGSGGHHCGPRCDHDDGDDQNSNKRYQDDVNDHFSPSLKRARRRS